MSQTLKKRGKVNSILIEKVIRVKAKEVRKTEDRVKQDLRIAAYCIFLHVKNATKNDFLKYYSVVGLCVFGKYTAQRKDQVGNLFD